GQFKRFRRPADLPCAWRGQRSHRLLNTALDGEFVCRFISRRLVRRKYDAGLDVVLLPGRRRMHPAEKASRFPGELAWENRTTVVFARDFSLCQLESESESQRDARFQANGFGQTLVRAPKHDGPQQALGRGGGSLS